jgi:pimeloyl-ACP methyl ester carboxylesterase
MEMSTIKYNRVDVDGFGVAYREAGLVGRPALLLLHGFPTSSHMFRNLTPKLADRYRVIAPDLPGFGQSDLPSREQFNYTFSNLAKVTTRFH